MNKFLSLFMSFVTLVCTIFILSAIPTYSDEIKIGVISKSDVVVREDASTSAKKLKTVSRVVVNILGDKKDTNGTKNPDTKKTYVWYKVEFPTSDDDTVGYVREDLVTIREQTDDADFEKQLKKFPADYRDDLTLLHKIYPNWEFVPDNVDSTFNSAVEGQDYLFYKLVQSKYNSWRSMRKGCYNWTTQNFVETDSGGWYGASRELIAYYMDPRNFLNVNNIYLFMKQSYDSTSQTVEGIEDLVEGTFLDAKITDKKDKYYGKRYAAVIRYAGKQSGVNAYVLASTILQEQGTKGATLSKGTTYKDKTVYNFFNFGASGKTSSEVLKNGKEYAYNQGWFTPTESIVAGATKYGDNYICDGQDTYFYKNYNVHDPDNLWHQYAQNVADSVSTSRFLKEAYIEKYDMQLTFRIPIYKSMPKKVSPLPEKSDKLNNYYFSKIEVKGLTPAFNRYTYEYSLYIEDDTSVYVKVPSGASYDGEQEFSLKKGENTVKLYIKSETGYRNTYLLNVESSKTCTLTVTTKKVEPKPETEVKIVKGDTNSDGNISITDLANVRLHLLELITLKDDSFLGADTNGDGKITITDLANIRLHLLELITLK